MPQPRYTKKELLDKLAFSIHVLQGRLNEEPSLPQEMQDAMVNLRGDLLKIHRLGVEHKLWSAQ